MKYHYFRRSLLAGMTCLLLVSGCNNDKPAPKPEETSDIATIEETYLTERNEDDNVDSPAIWHGPSGEHWLIATAKSTDKLIVYDAANGSVLRSVGASGEARGEFRRPNGIFVNGNFCFIVERDNHRVQVLTLPEFESLGSYGSEILRKPYGIALVPQSATEFTTYITDNYETPEETVPPKSELHQRVQEFQVTVTGNALNATHIKAFGDTTDQGALRVVESIAADPPHLLVADEDANQNDIKLYTMDGTFTGTLVGKDIFKTQPEGIALYATSDTSGYWIVTDQSRTDNIFHILDRNTFARLGSFSGNVTRNTDGIWVTNTAFGNFPEGAFFAVHDDGNVACFSWKTIRETLKLK